MVSASHKSFDGGAAGLLSRLKRLQSQKVAVGIPADHTERKDTGKAEDITNADLVYIHTHGVRALPMRREMQPEIDKGTEYSVALQMYIHEHGSAMMQVPARPIIEPAVEKNSEGISELLGTAAKAAMSGDNIEQPLMDVGLYAAAKVKDWFTDPENGWDLNAPSTIKRKGSDKPLIDTSAMQGAITFVIRGDDR